MQKDTLALVQKLHEKLLLKKLKISTAESCTGGMLSNYLTAFPGSSKFFLHGFITYSNSAKIKFLNVPSKLINQYGAVSKEVAIAMANGALIKDDNAIAIAITGIAGPAGESKNKPVGLVYFSIASKKFCHNSKKFFFGHRNRIKEQSCKYIIGILLNRMV